MVFLEGGGWWESDAFNVEQGMAQGCSLYPILFSIFIKLMIYAEHDKHTYSLVMARQLKVCCLVMIL